MMSANCSLSRFIILLILTVCTFPTSAQEEREGVLFPEQQQRQQAIIAAPSGNDEPLEDPAPETPVVPAAITLPDQDKMAVMEEDIAELEDQEGLSTLERQSVRALQPIILEERVQQQVLQTELKQFGYDLFNQPPSSFESVKSMPVPADYMVGPGDTFSLQIFGSVDLQYQLVVTRGGELLVPEVGPVQVAGLTLEEAKLAVSELVSNLRTGTKTLLTLAELNSIQVNIVGEVEQPGSYTISGLSSLVNALISTGGIKRSGSLRNIEVRRNNVKIAEMDLYELLLKGKTDGNINLRHGDVVFIPPIGPVVSVAGEVQRPAIYELKEEKTVGDLISLAGGTLPAVSPSKTQIQRLSDSGSLTLLEADISQGGETIEVKNGDLIRLFPTSTKMDDVVLLSGHVLSPGGYQWRPGMRVSDLIDSTEKLRIGAEFDVALIEREEPKRRRTRVAYFKLGEALQNPGSSADLALKPRDRVVVFDTHTPRANQLFNIVRKMERQVTASQLAQTFEILGQVRHAGKYPLEENSRALDLILQSGGIQSNVDLNYSLLVRTDPLSAEIEFIPFRLNRALNNKTGDHNPLIRPGDRLYVFGMEGDRVELIANDIERLKSQTNYGEMSPVVNVTGKVKHPGLYPMSPGFRVEDLIRAAGGMTEDAYGVYASLARKSLLDQESSQTEEMTVSLQYDGNALADMRTILKPYDHLFVRQKPEWNDTPKVVKVTGEVRHPGSYQVGKRETLCGVIQRAGGLNEDAYLFGTVFLRESVRQREQKAMDRMFNQLDNTLANVYLSPGYDNETMMPAMDTLEVIKQLEPERAAGRMVVDMESAVNGCNETADLILENDDHIHVPTLTEEVTVIGHVYSPASHQYRSDLSAQDYINLSGGTKEFANPKNAYVVLANGEVVSARSSSGLISWLGGSGDLKVTPGSTVFVPLSVDRINDHESAQSWVDLIYKLALSAASVDYLFDK